jgi:hypothetical protein
MIAVLALVTFTAFTTTAASTATLKAITAIGYGLHGDDNYSSRAKNTGRAKCRRA